MKQLLLLNFLFFTLSLFSSEPTYHHTMSLSREMFTYYSQWDSWEYFSPNNIRGQLSTTCDPEWNDYRIVVFLNINDQYPEDRTKDNLAFRIVGKHPDHNNWQKTGGNAGVNLDFSQNPAVGYTQIADIIAIDNRTEYFVVKVLYNASPPKVNFKVRFQGSNNRPYPVTIDIKSNIGKNADVTLAKDQSADIPLFDIEVEDSHPDYYEFEVSVDGTIYKVYSIEKASVEDEETYTITFEYGGANGDEPLQPEEIDGLEIYIPDELQPDPDTGEPPITSNQPPESVEAPITQINDTQVNNESPPTVTGEHDGNTSGNEITEAINNSGYEINISDSYEDIEFPDITDLKNTYDSFKDRIVSLPTRVDNIIGTIFQLRHFPNIGKKYRFEVFGGYVVDFSKEERFFRVLRGFFKLMIVIWFFLKLFDAVKYLGS